ncbi:MAG: hypothetical protein Unbinned4118contig1001_5 [Prokaryotic dsDNA virus sp.]|jgi:hypothetical protein|nr:MAG: hypothetical protein Unbinned4118contig1001_5 [Prokaryotic dsDNA virus sp.]|tara:strand:- start:717 stop:959 length:243 start_codon:yes stop_codon:yes gene_type:complete
MRKQMKTKDFVTITVVRHIEVEVEIEHSPEVPQSFHTEGQQEHFSILGSIDVCSGESIELDEDEELQAIKTFLIEPTKPF